MEEIKKFKLWKYKRTSTPKKKIAEDELIKQEEGIKKLLFLHPNFEIYKTTEEAVSGTKKGKERPLWDNIITNINECDGVIVDSISRWSRTVEDAVRTIKELADKGKLFVSNELIYNPHDSNSKIMLALFGALVEVDRILTVDRLTEGRRIYHENGGKLGRNIIQIPDKIKNQILELYNKQFGYISIAKFVSPFQIINEKNEKEEISIGKNVVIRILKENNIILRTKKTKRG